MHGVLPSVVTVRPAKIHLRCQGSIITSQGWTPWDHAHLSIQSWPQGRPGSREDYQSISAFEGSLGYWLIIRAIGWEHWDQTRGTWEWSLSCCDDHTRGRKCLSDLPGLCVVRGRDMKHYVSGEASGSILLPYPRPFLALLKASRYKPALWLRTQIVPRKLWLWGWQRVQRDSLSWGDNVLCRRKRTCWTPPGGEPTGEYAWLWWLTGH